MAFSVILEKIEEYLVNLMSYVHFLTGFGLNIKNCLSKTLNTLHVAFIKKALESFEVDFGKQDKKPTLIDKLENFIEKCSCSVLS